VKPASRKGLGTAEVMTEVRVVGEGSWAWPGPHTMPRMAGDWGADSRPRLHNGCDPQAPAPCP